MDGQAIRRPGIIKRQVTSAKMTSLTRPKENRNILGSFNEEQNTKNEKTNSIKKEAGSKEKEKEAKKHSRKIEGSWAAGCMCAAEQAIPIATAFCTNDENKLKVLGTSGDCKGRTQQQRGTRTLAIPKAVLRYSNDAGMHPRTQLPISIGPDNTVKHF